MDEQKPDDVNETPVPQPANEDAAQFAKWMSEYGRPALIGLAVAVVALLGISVWRGQKESKAEAAVQALFQARSPEEFQQLAMADPKAGPAPMALASAAAEFYAQNRYDEALSAYQNFLGLYPDHLLAADASLGVAASLEALDDFQAAAESYESFAAANPDGALRPQAVMGAARCREQLGDFDAARALYEDFIAANPESTWLPQAESGLTFLKKAERARNRPAVEAPAAPEEAPAPEEAAPAEEVVVEEAAPAVEEEKAATKESKPRKKRAVKKTAAAETPAE